MTQVKPEPKVRIVALHGFLGQSSDWQMFAGEIQKLRPEIRIDTMNLFAVDKDRHPEVSWSELSMPDWAEVFNQTQKDTHLEKNILIGYSMGGRLALQAALDKPGLWDHVVLVSAHMGLEEGFRPKVREQSDADWSEKFLKLPWQEVIRLWNSQPVFVGSHEPERNEQEFSRPALAAALVKWSLAKQNMTEEDLRTVQARIHLMAGDKDTKYKNLYENIKMRALADEFHIVPDAGHRVIFDNPKELARQLVRHLKL